MVREVESWLGISVRWHGRREAPTDCVTSQRSKRASPEETRSHSVFSLDALSAFFIAPPLATPVPMLLVLFVHCLWFGTLLLVNIISVLICTTIWRPYQLYLLSFCPFLWTDWIEVVCSLILFCVSAVQPKIRRVHIYSLQLGWDRERPLHCENLMLTCFWDGLLNCKAKPMSFLLQYRIPSVILTLYFGISVPCSIIYICFTTSKRHIFYFSLQYILSDSFRY